MAEKELTYVLDEKPQDEDQRFVGFMRLPCSIEHIATGYLPITAADMAKIERRALQAETEKDVAELKLQLLAKFCSEMVAALRDGHITRDSLNI